MRMLKGRWQWGVVVLFVVSALAAGVFLSPSYDRPSPQPEIALALFEPSSFIHARCVWMEQWIRIIESLDFAQQNLQFTSYAEIFPERHERVKSFYPDQQLGNPFADGAGSRKI